MTVVNKLPINEENLQTRRSNLECHVYYRSLVDTRISRNEEERIVRRRDVK